ncbi:MAG: chitobiase/beta-hexosaminidase C-terminal domain-containing protein [Eubacterium sp.]|nr:chitobiase/beta-hexosaminidase C-terminal domain-containing protein [Eubacterium sp.]
MRTCENCGAQFPDDELICPVCGHEVQLVPDYVTIESKIQEDKKRKEDEEKRQREEQERLHAVEKRKQEIHRHVLLLSLLIAAAVAAVIISIAAWHYNRQSQSFSYQYEQAQNAYEVGDYKDALSWISKALKIDSSNTDGLYLEAEIYAAMGQNSDAEKTLISLINKDYSYTKAYDLLISLYTKDGNTDAIRNLLKNCKNKSVLSKYKDYLPDAPVISPDGGTYHSIQTVTITSSAKNGTIYYTTDDSDPDSSSTKYTGAFKLPEGTTTVKAIVITDKGMTSSIASQEFSIELDTPAAPKITPQSGTYTHMQDAEDTSGTLNSETVSSDSTTDVTLITVTVPDGYTCYYSFDQIPTKKSSKYTKPVSMRKGEHIFYAVLCSKDGKLGKVASATYVYNVVTATATATPMPTAAPTQSASETYTPADTYNSEKIATPTPTAEPTAEPTQKPTATPSSSSSSSKTEDENKSSDETQKSNTDTASGNKTE